MTVHRNVILYSAIMICRYCDTSFFIVRLYKKASSDSVRLNLIFFNWNKCALWIIDAMKLYLIKCWYSIICVSCEGWRVWWMDAVEEYLILWCLCSSSVTVSVCEVLRFLQVSKISANLYYVNKHLINKKKLSHCFEAMV